MRVNLQNVPGFVTNLDTVRIFEDLWWGGVQVLRGARISGWGTGPLFSVVLRNGFKILEDLALGEDAELEFVACHVKEGVFWAEDLAEEGVIKSLEPCPRDAYKRELYWEKGDGDLHILGDGWGRRTRTNEGICTSAGTGQTWNVYEIG